VAPHETLISNGNFPKRKISAAEFVPNTSYGYYLDSNNYYLYLYMRICAWLYPAGMYCPRWWGDAFDFCFFLFVMLWGRHVAELSVGMLITRGWKLFANIALY